ncbi:hypothetical protein [Ferrimonas marina]|uniref:Magnesium transporter n=1 Tax=Ferrimonas marina TaxID=299255 RepID=A0A1M5Z4P1_9GAMM|nr:hypothetical protein [Ferrimonas marina]SHI19247.1 hypothetical protein SAMN02745129_4647 [Ferrimonas marina]
MLKTILKVMTGIALFVAGVAFFMQGSTIHGTEIQEFDQMPTILPLMESTAFVGVIVMITLAVMVYVLYLLWQLHEAGVHKAQRNMQQHVEVVFILSLCGLFIAKVFWVAALVIAFTNWSAMADSAVALVKRFKEA